MLRALACCSLVVGLVGCASDVDLCGGESVCGVDGTTYGDYCAAGSAGVEVDYVGPCVGGCADTSCELGCAYGFATDASGCPRCECAPPPSCTDNTPCADEDVCVAGRCQPRGDAGVPADGGRDAGVPADGGRDAGVPDAVTGDSGRDDGGATDASACPTGMVLCDGACTPLGTLTDCLDCGDACTLVPGGDSSRMNVCTGTGCDVACRVGYADCDGDLSNGCESLHSQQYCGSCTMSCRSGDCSTGTCRCGEGLTYCDGACVDTATSALHCRYCGNPCGAGESCVDSGCVNTATYCMDADNWSCRATVDGCRATCLTNSLTVTRSEATCDPDTALSCSLPMPVGGTIGCNACREMAAMCCAGSG